MPGGRRKASEKIRWQLQWLDGCTFKVEQENAGLTDTSLQEWGEWMDAQFACRFKGKDSKDWPPLVASTLNFSRNGLGDEGVVHVVEYVQKRNISTLTVKFFKNGIGDRGASAIGQLLANSREPVHEVHLSHNRITEKGAKSIFEAVAQCRKYPFVVERGGRRGDSRGPMPVWLRMEHNCIQWSTVEKEIPPKVSWRAADTRESSWGSTGDAAMVCLHTSYKVQKGKSEPSSPASPSSPGSPSTPAAGSPSSQGKASRQGALGLVWLDKARQQQHLRRERGEDEDWPAVPHALEEEEHSENRVRGVEVPLYAFLGASALRRFAIAGTGEDNLFTFRGLLNLCRQGSMTCSPSDGRPTGRESERLLFVVTQAVLTELIRGAQSPGEHRQLESFLLGQDSQLQQCKNWGILEVLETKLHTELVKLAGWEQRAAELRLSKSELRTLDFACLWAAHLEATGRVLFITGDEALCALSAECACANGERGVTTVHVDQLERLFAADQLYGGRQLRAAASRQEAGDSSAESASCCRRPLCAQVVRALAVQPRSPEELLERHRVANGDVVLQEAQQLQRQQLNEALTLLGEARPLLLVSSAGGNGIQQMANSRRCLDRIDEARQRISRSLAPSMRYVEPGDGDQQQVAQGPDAPSSGPDALWSGLEARGA